MEKQSLIKYYCALFVVMVLLAGANLAVAETPTPTASSTPRETTTTSPAITPSGENLKAEPNDSMVFPLILSILALAVSGGAIALTIFNAKKFIDRIQSNDEKHTNKIKSLEKQYTDLLTSQMLASSSQPSEKITYSSATPSNSSAYLEASIDALSERISRLENKIKINQNSEKAINYSHNYYSQVDKTKAEINPFSEPDNLSQYEITQPVENLSYVELVNTYNINPKLLEQAAVKVSEPTDSINRRHADSSQKIVLEKANNSNYWVIRDDVSIDYWLLPKSKLRIDQFRYETTKALFECHAYHPEYSTFKLVKPAKVIPLSSDEQTWQLEEPGILEFIVEA